VVGVTLRLSRPDHIGVFYRIEGLSDTATREEDFAVPSGATVEFRPGEAEKLITFILMGDQVWEPTESFRIVARSPDLFGPEVTGTVFIENDDPVPAFSLSTTTLVEGDHSKTTDVVITSSQPVGAVLQYELVPLTASGSDVGLAVRDLAFSGSTTATASLPLLGDRAEEADETFLLRVIAGSTLVAEFTLTIADDDFTILPAAQDIPLGERPAP
jgi:hypothetical protein